MYMYITVFNRMQGSLEAAVTSKKWCPVITEVLASYRINIFEEEEEKK